MSLTVLALDAATADHDSQVLLTAAEALDDGATREAVQRLAASLRSGAVLATAEESVSPKVAGAMLGVSRQLVDRMIKDGRLASTTKPGSAHKLVRVSDVVQLDQERSRRNSAVDELVSGLLDDGDEH